MNLDWQTIRPLSGSRSSGFEELCSQLARVEPPTVGEFIRKGRPDAGVECYRVYSDGTEWAWQAKYFLALGSTQWSEIDSSVKTAIKKHPRLSRYFVCIPFDLPDARLDGKQSARETWNKRVSKWSEWARQEGMDVEFVWWGSHELLHRLQKTNNAGLTKFWFDATVFDETWFQRQLEDAIAVAGPRYSRELSIALPIATEFEAFGRSDRWLKQVKNLAKEVRRADRLLGYRSTQDDKSPGTLAELQKLNRRTIDALVKATVEPIGDVDIRAITDCLAASDREAETTAARLSLEAQNFEKSGAGSGTTEKGMYKPNPYREAWTHVRDLRATVHDVRRFLSHSSSVASSTLLVVQGEAGTGKTHLLCDVAVDRLKHGLPTVLVMGQSLVRSGSPWAQLLEQLDVSNLSAEEFVGCMEAAAQASGSRALLMIDAINEGAGRDIWPTHISSFLSKITRSPWVSVVMSVRTRYEETVLPPEVLAGAARITHSGFADREYDAMQVFFNFYGIALPSAPLFSPEFQNPLFLKTLCESLHRQGIREIPRGLQGITAVFELYLHSVDMKLSHALNYDPQAELVQRALRAFVQHFPSHTERWLKRADAQGLINSFLPGRNFAESLYRSLVDEGALIEDIRQAKDGQRMENVFVSYERFADHLVAESLLTARVRGRRRPLSALDKDRGFVPSGLLKALCIQVPERFGTELMDYHTSSRGYWGIDDAFRESLTWRSPKAFSDATKQWLNVFSSESEQDFSDTTGVLLSVSTVVGHPLNADYLHGRLIGMSMPERDASWGIAIHHLYDGQSAVHRLIEWSLALEKDAPVDVDTVDLAATALAWFLASSHRYLRDRATKALVCLLTGRINAVIRLLKKFHAVDDPYVRERIYAVAYGVAMRENTASELKLLAEHVYACFFSSRRIEPHLLLRDYARGVLERAHYLCQLPPEFMQAARPPYRSKWPRIPSQKALAPFMPNYSNTEKDPYLWARNRIFNSVMDDDFGRYVIGTNSWSTDWLALRLSAPRWESKGARLAQFRQALPAKVQRIWQAYENAEAELSKRTFPLLVARLVPKKDKQTISASEKRLLAAAKKRVEAARSKLLAALPAKGRRALQAIWVSREDHPPKFDLRLIQRYVVKRVFDLGWTTERFGRFDTYSAGYHGRDASKAERFGKKYQWIAYHEISAYVADNFQFLESLGGEESCSSYKGPWQDFFRDIDPSSTMSKGLGGEEKAGLNAWWAPMDYRAWPAADQGDLWVSKFDDLPSVRELILIREPKSKRNWVNCEGSFHWKQPIPDGLEGSELERREIWYHLSAYLVRSGDVEAFLKWAEGVDFWGRWMPNAPDAHNMFLGEHHWSPASHFYDRAYFGGEGWVTPNHGCPISVCPSGLLYQQSPQGFDCSIEDGFSLRLPSRALMQAMKLTWTGRSADFSNAEGRVLAFDPAAHFPGPGALLVDETAVSSTLKNQGLSLCWTLLGEKRVVEPGMRLGGVRSLRLSGAYTIANSRPVGFMNVFEDKPVRGKNIARPLKKIHTI